MSDFGVDLFHCFLFLQLVVHLLPDFQLNVHHQGTTGRAVPALVQKLVLGYGARLLLMRLDYYHSINEHVEYFYAKEFGKDREDRLCTAWLRQAGVPSAAAARRQAQPRASAPLQGTNDGDSPTSTAQRRRPLGLKNKRVSWSNDAFGPPPPNGNGTPQVSWPTC